MLLRSIVKLYRKLFKNSMQLLTLIKAINILIIIVLIEQLHIKFIFIIGYLYNNRMQY